MTRKDLEDLIRRYVGDDAAVTAILRASDEYGAGLAGGTARGLDAMRAWRDGQQMARLNKPASLPDQRSGTRAPLQLSKRPTGES